MKHLHRYLIALTVVLAVLKLTLWQSLSWWWVFAPIYAPIVFTVTLILLSLVAALLFSKNIPDEPMDMEIE
jgi:hypothetical protein